MKGFTKCDMHDAWDYVRTHDAGKEDVQLGTYKDALDQMHTQIQPFQQIIHMK